jgi:hypothetical protein
MVNRLTGFEATIDEELSYDMIVKKAVDLKARYWHIGFYQARCTNARKDRSG